MFFRHKRIRVIYFLPYLPLEKEIRIGNMLFWPFHPLKGKYVNDAAILLQLEKVFRSYVDRSGGVTQSITIASIGKPQFRQFSGAELDNVDSAVKILAFASMMNIQYGYQYRNSENFQLYWQEFIPGEDMISMTHRFRRQAFGGYVQKLGPYKLEQVKFVQPESVLLAAATEISPGMLAGLEKILTRKGIDGDADRILRSLEWFYFSHFDIRDIPDTSVVVMMATAFESLLNLPFRGKTHEFAKTIEHCLVSKAGFLDTAASLRTSRLLGTKTYSYTKAGWWAYEFYGLRSEIVHGVTWNLMYEGKSQLEIADLVFIEVLKRKLEEKNLFKYMPRDEDFRKQIFKHVGV
jgi:hypothetical protein